MFDEDTYRADLRRCCQSGVPGVYTAGTTGEFYAMEFDEWKAVTKVTIEECKNCGTPVMIGVTSTYTLGVQRRAAYAAELQADAIQLALPFWMELDDRQLVPFFKDVTAACPGLGFTIYETSRAKKAFTVDQHRAIYEATGCYLVVKANFNTVGRTPEGCRQLSEFINVWVGENELSRLGPHGAVGAASAMVYANPRILLHMFDLLQQKKWDQLQPWSDKIDRLIKEGLSPFTANGYTDTAYDHLMGVATGFLTMSLRSRGPYISATEQDVRQLRTWLKANFPEFLEI
jgi:dihydrodipicolinate synthase/N-acetylneuraminate lyase